MDGNEVMVTMGEGERSAEARFTLLTSVPERLRGLLGSSSEGGGVVLAPCSSIHTIGMSYPIDVAFVTREGAVLASRRGMRPGGVFSCRGAFYAFERPQATGRWLKRGETVTISGVPAAK